MAKFFHDNFKQNFHYIIILGLNYRSIIEHFLERLCKLLLALKIPLLSINGATQDDDFFRQWLMTAKSRAITLKHIIYIMFYPWIIFELFFRNPYLKLYKKNNKPYRLKSDRN